jgi:polyhydroxyalkanoate synthase
VSPIQIRPERAAEEILEFNRKLGAGLRNLANIGPIEAGVTPKEAVYREDKLVLHRFQAPAGIKQNKVPVLIAYALVNRPYMADLQEDPMHWSTARIWRIFRKIDRPCAGCSRPASTST